MAPAIAANRQFVLESAALGDRLDGRGAYDMRKMCLRLGPALGAVELTLGETCARAQVSCQLAQPHPSRPTDGLVVVTGTISRAAAAQSAPGAELEIARFLQKALKSSHAIDTEGLCVVTGKQVWVVSVDVHLVENAGNMLDCACLAAVAALRHFRRPDVTISGESVVVHSLDEREPVPLSVRFTPLCITFAILGDSQAMLCDPTTAEEECSSGSITACLNHHGELSVLHKLGGAPLPLEKLAESLHVAAVRVRELCEQLDGLVPHGRTV